jgi:cardiolipin synthase
MVLPAMSDFAPVLYAGRHHDVRLMAAGVELHELQTAMLHAKTATIDGVVSTVGSGNMDWRSFAANDEVNAVVPGQDFGQAMTRVFQRDLQASRRIDSAQWDDRPWLEKLKSLTASGFERLW